MLFISCISCISASRTIIRAVRSLFPILLSDAHVAWCKLLRWKATVSLFWPIHIQFIFYTSCFFVNMITMIWQLKGCHGIFDRKMRALMPVISILVLLPEDLMYLLLSFRLEISVMYLSSSSEYSLSPSPLATSWSLYLSSEQKHFRWLITKKIQVIKVNL